MPSVDDAVPAAAAWLEVDPDPRTRAELTELLVAAASDLPAAEELQRRFEGRLRFGTAGLRAPLGAGPARMNRVVVRQATAAVMATLPAGARVVIGHDARRNSAVFAADAAAVVAAAGGEALLVGQAPTPVAAHAVVDRAADAGIVITASHNPPGDNGYKLYDAGGVQIVPPTDAHVEAHMSAGGLPARGLPPPAAGGAIRDIGPEAIDRYLAELTARLRGSQPADDMTGGSDADRRPRRGDAVPAQRSPPPAGGPPEVVYTPLHGVGAEVLGELFERLGMPAPAAVASQVAPDGDFPTVSFPNPEEPGALDEAFALAAERGADLVIANDPDADRLAVAVPAATRPAGGPAWYRFTGDELGALLADCLLRRREAAGDTAPALLAATVVSSRMLAAMAESAGVSYSETLTGFKWIARAADGRAERLLFGYEEALGYAVCDAVRDKDGISAAALAVQLATELRAAGSSLPERLDELHRRHGVHVTGQVTVRFPPAEARSGPASATSRLREHPPTEVAGQPVVSVTDYRAACGPLPPTDMLAFGLEAGDRVIVRPSGTEPKLKAYIETVEQLAAGDLDAARHRARDRLGRIAEAVQPLVAPRPS
jgi:phosphomannomutase